MSQSTVTRPVGVQELQRAWHALQDGQFRARPTRGPQTTARRAAPPTSTWSPTEPVLPVLGCIGQAGATTVAVAIATVTGSARVLECASATASGLAAAATAEHGRSANAWSLGRRERVWLARAGDLLIAPDETPVPDEPPVPVDLTILDVGWETGQVMASRGWIRHQLATLTTLVVVTSPTVPGLRRLETALTLLAPARGVIAVLGPQPRRWPSNLTASLGPLASAALKEQRLVALPTDKGLALRGLDATPLPTSLLKAAETILQRTAAEDTPQERQPE